MSNKKTLVLGASENPERYSNRAIKKLRNNGHDVVAIGIREGKVNDVPIQKNKVELAAIDTVTMYMNAQHQQQYEDYILLLKPKRIIFNPGAENDRLAAKEKQNGIEPIEACTLVMLATGQY